MTRFEPAGPKTKKRRINPNPLTLTARILQREQEIGPAPSQRGTLAVKRAFVFRSDVSFGQRGSRYSKVNSFGVDHGSTRDPWPTGFSTRFWLSDALLGAMNQPCASLLARPDGRHLLDFVVRATCKAPQT